ncbi:hypothetical protein QJQ45_003755 [Haematococcus lacustris]|nr:hypothetical protein QJQ45_003755 [Haematococcus lacustris]
MSLVAQCLRGSGPVPRSKNRIRLKARENEAKGHGAAAGRVVLVDEHRPTRVSSAVNGQQPLAPRKPPQAPRSSQEATQAAASEPGPSTPLPAKRSKRTKAKPAAEHNKGKGKAAKAEPAPQPGRWLDRDCNAALNIQRIGESKWRPLELCYWPDQGALPAKGKEYPGPGYKRLGLVVTLPVKAPGGARPLLSSLRSQSASTSRVSWSVHAGEGLTSNPKRTEKLNQPSACLEVRFRASTQCVMSAKRNTRANAAVVNATHPHTPTTAAVAAAARVAAAAAAAAAAARVAAAAAVATTAADGPASEPAIGMGAGQAAKDAAIREVLQADSTLGASLHGNTGKRHSSCRYVRSFRRRSRSSSSLDRGWPCSWPALRE